MFLLQVGNPYLFVLGFCLAATFPNCWIPCVSQLESNISKLPLWQFWFYHSGLSNLHPKLCVFFGCFDGLEFGNFHEFQSTGASIYSNPTRFFYHRTLSLMVGLGEGSQIPKVYHHDEKGNHFIGTSLSSPNQVSATSTAAERLDFWKGWGKWQFFP